MRRWIIASWMLAAPLAGCDQVRGVLDHPTLAPVERIAVRPSAPPKKTLDLVVAGEREIGPLARRLGTTVEDIVLDNAIVPGTPLQDGQVLRVRSSRVALDRYLERRAKRAAHRAEIRAAREAAKRDGKLKKKRRRGRRHKRKPKHD